jgi:carboxyl-terminal processing protease
MIPEALRRAGSLVAIAAAPALAHAQATGDVQADSFQAAWRIVHETHFDTTFNGVNWVALGDSLRPLAAGASRDRVRGLIAGMLARRGSTSDSSMAGSSSPRLITAGPPSRRASGRDGCSRPWIPWS